MRHIWRRMSAHADCGLRAWVRNSNRTTIKSGGRTRARTQAAQRDRARGAVSSAESPIADLEARRQLPSEPANFTLDGSSDAREDASLHRPGEAQRRGGGRRAELHRAGGERGSAGELQRGLAERHSQDSTSGQTDRDHERQLSQGDPVPAVAGPLPEADLPVRRPEGGHRGERGEGAPAAAKEEHPPLAHLRPRRAGRPVRAWSPARRGGAAALPYPGRRLPQQEDRGRDHERPAPAQAHPHGVHQSAQGSGSLHVSRGPERVKSEKGKRGTSGRDEEGEEEAVPGKERDTVYIGLSVMTLVNNPKSSRSLTQSVS